MNRLTKISIAITCALGVTAVVAQTVFGGPAAGAPPAPVAASPGVATAGAVFFVGMGLAAVAGATQSSDTPVTHNP